MDQPVQITFRDVPPSAAVEARIQEEAEALRQYDDRIVRCRVVVEQPHRHRHQGRLFAIHIDLTVPGGLGGRETIRELAKLDPDVRAIVASGYVDDSVLADPHAAGFAGVLTKPFTIGDLDSTLRMVTARPPEAS